MIKNVLSIKGAKYALEIINNLYIMYMSKNCRNIPQHVKFPKEETHSYFLDFSLDEFTKGIKLKLS